jgi:hypothetical protein
MYVKPKGSIKNLFLSPTLYIRSALLLLPNRGVESKQSTCGLSSRTVTHQRGLQHLHGVLAFVEGGDGVDVQIHAEPVAELIVTSFGSIPA